MIVTKFDSVGKKPELKLNSKTRHATIFGGILTILSSVAVTVIGCYFFSILIRRQKMQVNVKDDYRAAPETNLTQVSFAYRLVDAFYIELPEAKSYFNMSMIWYTRDSDGLWTSKEISAYPCSLNDFEEDERDFLSLIDLKTYLCLNKTQISQEGLVNGTYGDSVAYNVPILFVQECVNTSVIHSPVCKSASEINARLAYVYLDVLYFDYLIDHSNVTNPINKMMSSFSFRLSQSIYTTMNIFFETIIYRTDYGYVLQDIVEEEVRKPTGFTKEIQLTKNIVLPELFAALYLTNNKIGKGYSRSYLTFQEVLASIGGIYKFIFVFSGAINILFTNSHFYKFLGDRLFSFNKTLELAKKETEEKLNSKSVSVARGNYTNIHLEPLPLIQKIKTYKQKKFELKVKWWNLYHFYWCDRNNNMKILTRIKNKFDRLISIDNILNRINELEKRSFILLNQNERNLIKLIPKPDIGKNCNSLIQQEYINEEKDFDKNILNEMTEQKQEINPNILKKINDLIT
jgi:hypothetical protein